MSTKTITKTIEKTRLSVKTQTLATIAAIVAAVALPQVLHVAGRIFGVNTALGEMFLPMHLPVILVGLLAGPFAGAIAGIASPICSYALSGMPAMLMLPIMTVELFGYGLSAGLLRNAKMPTLVKVLASQVMGRVLRAVAILVSIYILGNQMLQVAAIWNSIASGLVGLIIQWVTLPIIVRQVEKIK